MTNAPAPHLSEEDRQGTADGTLAATDRERVDAHLTSCRDCAADVASLTALMHGIDESRRAAPRTAPELEALWPEIRRRIEGSKVVDMEVSRTAPRRLRMDPWLIGVAASVAAITAVTVLRVARPAIHAPAVGVTPADSVYRLADDSIKGYQEEAARLLDELQLDRARLMPETQASIDEDLRTVDQAIAELQAAIARDPRNPALRAMLASSYRQKVDVLKKVSNAS